MPAKPKASAKVGAKAKREAIAKALPGVKVYPENMDFLYRRRRLATVRDGKSRELQYIVEFDCKGAGLGKRGVAVVVSDPLMSVLIRTPRRSP